MDASNPSLALEIATAISFVLFAGAFWAVSSLGQWAIAPVDRWANPALRPPRVRTRFSLAEVLLLLVQVQLAAGASLWVAASHRGWAMIASALVGCCVAAMWWASVRHLAKNCVANSHRRLTFLTVVVPLACLAIGGGLWFNGRAVVEIAQHGDFAISSWLWGNFACMASFVVCRTLSHWVIGGRAALSAA